MRVDKILPNVEPPKKHREYTPRKRIIGSPGKATDTYESSEKDIKSYIEKAKASPISREALAILLRIDVGDNLASLMVAVLDSE